MTKKNTNIKHKEKKKRKNLESVLDDISKSEKNPKNHEYDVQTGVLPTHFTMQKGKQYIDSLNSYTNIWVSMVWHATSSPKA